MWSSNITPPGHNGEDPNENEIVRILKFGDKVGIIMVVIYATVQVLESLGLTTQPEPVQPTPKPVPPTPTPSVPIPMSIPL